ncbi:MAG: replication protein RepA, partial [Rhodoplanes sp.]
MRPSKDRLLELVDVVEPGSDDVTYTHAVFAQCFLPLRKLPKVQKFYEVHHGRAALIIMAGALLNPATKRFVEMDVPAGSAARIALAHINNHLIRSRSLDEALTVPMGESLRDFMGYQGITVCGSNGKEIAHQIHNVAAARIGLGVWSGDHAHQINTQVAEEIDFWLEKDRRQRTLWQPVMRVSEQYAEAIRNHCVPHDMRALIGLYKDTRAMDIYVWLAYRLPRVPLRHDLFIRYDDLKPIFGTGVAELRIRQLFKRALRAALAWYRDVSSIAPSRCPLISSAPPTVGRLPAAGDDSGWCPPLSIGTEAGPPVRRSCRGPRRGRCGRVGT